MPPRFTDGVGYLGFIKLIRGEVLECCQCEKMMKEGAILHLYNRETHTDQVEWAECDACREATLKKEEAK